MPLLTLNAGSSVHELDCEQFAFIDFKAAGLSMGSLGISAAGGISVRGHAAVLSPQSHTSVLIPILSRRWRGGASATARHSQASRVAVHVPP